jgi:uncharacterized membrane protein HdeD (DUF308 family)
MAQPKQRPNFNTYYFVSVMAGLAAGIYTEDKYIGILVAIALVLMFAGMKQRYNQNQNQ